MSIPAILLLLIFLATTRSWIYSFQNLDLIDQQQEISLLFNAGTMEIISLSELEQSLCLRWFMSSEFMIQEQQLLKEYSIEWLIRIEQEP